jgi:hypothetical protein
MNIRELLKYCNAAFLDGTLKLSTEIMIAQPGDLRAWPTYGAKILSGTPTDPEVGTETVPILVVITNMSDEEDDDDADGSTR